MPSYRRTYVTRIAGAYAAEPNEEMLRYPAVTRQTGRLAAYHDIKQGRWLASYFG